MADLLSSVVANNYAKNVRANGLNGRTLIVKFSKTNMTDAQVNAWVAYLTAAHGSDGTGDSAFTVAGLGTADGSPFVSGATDVLFLALQGTGNYDDSTVQGLSGSPTVDLIAVFQDNYQND